MNQEPPDVVKDLFGYTNKQKDKEAEYWLRNKYPGIYPKQREYENTPQN